MDRKTGSRRGGGKGRGELTDVKSTGKVRWRDGLCREDCLFGPEKACLEKHAEEADRQLEKTEQMWR
jgi:hypothetical protein